MSPKPLPRMAQISYWKTVKQLHDIYIYNCENDNINCQEECIKKSIKDFIKSYYFHKTEEEVYIELKAIMCITSYVNDAMIILGQKWYEE